MLKYMAAKTMAVRMASAALPATATAIDNGFQIYTIAYILA